MLETSHNKPLPLVGNTLDYPKNILKNITTISTMVAFGLTVSACGWPSEQERRENEKLINAAKEEGKRIEDASKIECDKILAWACQTNFRGGNVYMQVKPIVKGTLPKAWVTMVKASYYDMNRSGISFCRELPNSNTATTYQKVGRNMSKATTSIMLKEFPDTLIYEESMKKCLSE